MRTTPSFEKLVSILDETLFYCYSDGLISPLQTPRARALVLKRFHQPQDEASLHISEMIAETPAQIAQVKFILDTWVNDYQTFGMFITELPSITKFDDHSYRIEFFPEIENGQLFGYVVRLQLIQKDEHQISETEKLVRAVLEDIDVSRGFLVETQELMDSLLKIEEKSSLAKTLHTIKGNSGCFQLKNIVNTVHHTEDKLKETGPSEIIDDIKNIQREWGETIELFKGLLESNDKILMTRSEYDDLMMDLMSNREWSEILVLVMRLTLEPIDLRFKRLATQLRRISEEAKKDIRVSIDSQSLRTPLGLKYFWGSLIHVIRNLVDHGIEDADERAAAGKPASGQVWFEAAESDDNLIIRIRDDGRGINWAKISEKAKKSGMPSGTHDELVEALFSEGISTRDMISTESGRGVGTSAVKEELEKLSGTVQVESEAGKGTTFTFSIPLATLANLQLAG